MEKFYITRFNNLKNCLEDFSNAKEKDFENDSFILSGIINKFQLTFDLSWKILKDIIRDYYKIDNYATGSPRENLKEAFKLGIIEDDKTWFDMLKLRNELTHDYDYALSKESCKKIVYTYIDFFMEFKNNIENLIKTFDD